MFGIRYHVASLAAVFFALAVGVLLGVAISNQDLLTRAQESLNAQVIADLRRQLESERTRAAGAGRREGAAEELLESAYPLLVDRRLEGKSFAVLFVGPVEGDVRAAVERTLADAGAGAPMRMIALDVPLDPQALDGRLSGDAELAGYAVEGEDFAELGRVLGRELIDGGETPVWSALSSELVEERTGAASAQVDGAVVARTWAPAPADAVDEAQRQRATRTLVEGLLDGLDGAGFPVVGVETSTAADSSIDLFRERGISSVDAVDTVAGRLALALVLAGAPEGHYGVKDSASDGTAPPIPPPPTDAGE